VPFSEQKLETPSVIYMYSTPLTSPAKKLPPGIFLFWKFKFPG